VLTKALIVAPAAAAGSRHRQPRLQRHHRPRLDPRRDVLVTILAGGVNLRSRLLKDQIDGWKGNYEQAKEHAAMLEDRLDQSQRLATELAQELSDAKVVIQRLEQLPNLERLVRLMSETQEKQREFLLELHREGMAAHKKTFDAVEHIAVRIHPSTQKET
jgi:gas vesicle protein